MIDGMDPLLLGILAAMAATGLVAAFASTDAQRWTLVAAAGVVAASIIVAGAGWSNLRSGPRRLAADGLTVGELVAVGSALAAGLAVVATVARVSRDADGRRRRWPQRQVRGNATVAAITMATVGVYLCLPETDLIAVVVGPVLMASIMTLGTYFAPPGPTAVGVWAVLVAWMVVGGGGGRPAAMVGAAGCMVLVAPAMFVSDEVIRRPATWVGATLAVAGCSRVAGIQGSVAVAVAATAVAWALYAFFMVPVFRSVVAEREFGPRPGPPGRGGAAGRAWGR